jgi:DNA-binding PadR family transcriptional regulator
MIGADAIRGHIDLIVLAILEGNDSYAYALSRTISTWGGGQYPIKQTTLYTALKRLQSQGLLDSFEATSESGRPRTYYTLTAIGHERLNALRAEWSATRDLVDHFAGSPPTTSRTEPTGTTRTPPPEGSDMR